MRYPEHIEQVALVRWARLSLGKYPELETLHSSLNAGKRRPQEAARLKQAGMLAGIPDLFLPVARGGWNGLWVEMKSEKGKVSMAQADMHKKLEANGYLVVVCRSFEIAKTEIILYLAG